MGAFGIQYLFTFHDGAHALFDLRFDERTFERLDRPSVPLPEWTALDFHKCPHCPLDSARRARCPLAADLAGVVGQFDGWMSYEKVYLEVQTDARIISQYTTVQEGLSSLLGVLAASSGCPRTAWLRPMARFHLPLANDEETVFRTTAAYLLARHFAGESPDTDDLSGLRALHAELQVLNQSLAKRLRAATESDALVNALVRLDNNTRAAVFDKRLGEFARLFTNLPEAAL